MWIMLVSCLKLLQIFVQSKLCMKVKIAKPSSKKSPAKLTRATKTTKAPKALLPSEKGKLQVPTHYKKRGFQYLGGSTQNEVDDIEAYDDDARISRNIMTNGNRGKRKVSGTPRKRY